MQIEEACQGIGIEANAFSSFNLESNQQVIAGGRNWQIRCSKGFRQPQWAAGESLLVAWHPPNSVTPWSSFLSDPALVKEGAVLEVSVAYAPLGLCKEPPVAIINWYSDQHELLFRELLDPMGPMSESHGGLFWHRLQRVVEVPRLGVEASMQLCTPPGVESGTLWRAELGWRVLRSASEHRQPITVAAVKVGIQRPATIDGNLRLMQEAVAKACQTRTSEGEKPQLVCLSEGLVDWGVPLSLSETAQSIDGPVIQSLKLTAQEHQTHICTAFYERVGELCYNTAILIDSSGEIVGTYRKTHLALTEYEAGVVPGEDYPVFDTSLGRIGMLICWDLYFPEPWRAVALKGADLVLLPIGGDAIDNHRKHVWPTRAMDNSIFIVAAGFTPKTPASIISPDGDILAEANEHMGVASATLRSQQKRGHRWLSVGNAFGETALLFQQRRPQLYGAISLPLDAVKRPGQTMTQALPIDYLVEWHGLTTQE